MLEDTVAKYTVQIVQDGSTAPAVQEFNNLRAAAQSTTTAATETASSFENLAGKAYYVRSSIDAIRFAAADGGTRAGFYAIDEALRAMLASGLKIGEIIPIVGGIAAAIGAGFLLWEEFGDHMETAEQKAKKLADTLEKLPAILKQLSDAQLGGLLNSAKAAQYEGILNGSVPLYSYDAPGNGMAGLSLDPVHRNPRATRAGAATVYGTPATQQQKQDYVDQQLLLDNINKTQSEAAAALKKIHDQDSADSLTGIQKEIAAENLRYQEELQHIKELHDAAVAAGGKDDSGAMGAATARHNTNLQNISDKASDDLNKSIAEYFQLSDEIQKQIDSMTAKDAQEKARAVSLMNEWMKAGPSDGLDPTAHAGEGGGNDTNTFSDQINAQLLSVQDMGVKTADSLSSGFAGAFTSFIDGSKTAKEAFEEFAQSFLQDISKMLAQQALLNLFGQSGSGGSGGSGIFGSLSSLFGGGAAAGAGAAGAGAGLFDDAGSALAGFAANGGIFPRMMADGGFAGMFSSATYFPRFNVVGGEAGTEMLAALAKPTFRSIGGIDSIVGNAGSNRLAIANADEMERRAGGVGGHIHIQIDHTPETQARIVSQAIDGAEVRVAKSMTRNSKFRQAVRSGTTT